MRKAIQTYGKGFILKFSWMVFSMTLVGGLLFSTLAIDGTGEHYIGITAEADTSEVLTVAEEMPEIVGGMQELYSKINYPRRAVRDGIEGRVFIQFVVDREGNVRDPQILRDIGGGCGDAAIEAVKKVEFTPGRHNGEFVNVQYSMPVTFRLQN